MRHSIAIVGVGPRGTYALEFLTRVLRAFPLRGEVDVHLVETAEFGAGSIWRTTQPEYLLMNTVASQVTAFADERVDENDPFEPGPSMYQWLQARGIEMEPNECPPRALHGRYLVEAFQDICSRPLPGVTLHTWNCRAVDLQSLEGQSRIVLDGGHLPIMADVVLLTTGHSSHTSPMQDELAAYAHRQSQNGNSRIRFLPTIYPVEQHLETLDETVSLGILGLGLTSIDGIAAVTEGKGGRFERDGEGRLMYHRSGKEPRIAAWSLPGLPPAARGINQKGATFRHPARFLTRARVDALRVQARAATGTPKLDFQRDAFPLLLLEMEYVYYLALCGARFAVHYLAVAEDPDARAEFLSEVDPTLRFRWDHLENPLAGRTFASREEYTDFLKAFIRRDLEEAARGSIDGPYKAATDVLRDLRGNIRYVVELGGLTPESHRWFDRVFWPLHNQIAAGPPAIRLEQLLALMEAGVLELSFGPNPRLSPCPEHGCFQLTSQTFPGEPYLIDVLADGRIQAPNVHSDRSSLMANLLARGAVRPFANVTESHRYEPCGIDATEDHQVIGADGTVHERLYSMGILNEGLRLYTFVAASPGVNAKPLAEARSWATRVRDQLWQLEEEQMPEEHIWEGFSSHEDHEESPYQPAGGFRVMTMPSVRPLILPGAGQTDLEGPGR